MQKGDDMTSQGRASRLDETAARGGALKRLSLCLFFPSFDGKFSQARRDGIGSSSSNLESHSSSTIDGVVWTPATISFVPSYYFPLQAKCSPLSLLSFFPPPFSGTSIYLFFFYSTLAQLYGFRWYVY